MAQHFIQNAALQVALLIQIEPDCRRREVERRRLLVGTSRRVTLKGLPCPNVELNRPNSASSWRRFRHLHSASAQARCRQSAGKILPRRPG